MVSASQVESAHTEISSLVDKAELLIVVAPEKPGNRMTVASDIGYRGLEVGGTLARVIYEASPAVMNEFRSVSTGECAHESAWAFGYRAWEAFRKASDECDAMERPWPPPRDINFTRVQLHLKRFLECLADVALPDFDRLRNRLRTEAAKAMRQCKDESERRQDGKPDPAIAESEFRRVIAAVGDDVAIRAFGVARDGSMKVDEKMIELLKLDKRYGGWDSGQWAELLGCTSANVRQTKTWRTLRGSRKRQE